jgi:hypothetical protein
MKNNREDEPIWLTIHIYMEMSQGDFLCSYVKQAKMLFKKIFFLQNRRAGGWTRSYLGGDGGCNGGKGRWWGKGRGECIWCKYCVYMYVNGKMIPMKLFQEWGMRGQRRVVEEVNSSIVYLIYYKNFYKCFYVPHLTQ